MITNHVLDVIYNNHSMLITEWNNSLLSRNLLEVYANAVHEKGAALQNCFGFIEDIVRPIAKPGVKKKNHAQWAQKSPFA